MSLATCLLAPILVPQALWVAARATRLPEASGPREGQTGTGPPLRLLVLGDSSAAGVGVGRQQDALAGQVAARLGARFRVAWRVRARSGATTASTLDALRAIPPEPCDFVVIALGVNDAKNGVSRKAWVARYTALLAEIRDRCGAPQICVSGLPPLGAFPALPAPLNGVLGRRAELLDTDLRGIAARTPRCCYLPLDFDMDTGSMAADGFHPGPRIYAAWGQRAAELYAPDGPAPR